MYPVENNGYWGKQQNIQDVVCTEYKNIQQLFAELRNCCPTVKYLELAAVHHEIWRIVRYTTYKIILCSRSY